MAEESPIKMMPTDEVIDAKIEAALEEPLRTLEEHGEALAGKADGNIVYDKTTVDAKVKTVADAVAEHVGDTTHHITALERETWNNKPDKSLFYTRNESDERFARTTHEHERETWFTNVISSLKSWAVNTFSGIIHSHINDSWFVGALNVKANIDHIAPIPFAEKPSGISYEIGELVSRDGDWWKRNNVVGDDSVWSPNHWDEASYSDIASRLSKLKYDGKANKEFVSDLMATAEARDAIEDEKTRKVFDELSRMDDFTETSTETDSFDVAIRKLSQLLGENVATYTT